MFRKRATQDLKDVKIILDRNNISFHLEYGTCLGAVKYRDFIEWDYDIDLGSFDVPSLEKKAKIMKEFEEVGFKASWDMDFLKVYRKDIEPILPIDICFYRRGRYEYFYWRNGDRWGNIPPELFVRFKLTWLGDEEYLVPNPPEKYLEHWYPTWERLEIVKKVVDFNNNKKE